MATTTTTERDKRQTRWLAGVAAGVAGGVAMGALINAMNPPTLSMAIAGLYGLQGSLVSGWVAHLFHSAVFGVGFAALAATTRLRAYTDRVATSTAFGVGYGVALWVVAAAVIMPVWLQTVGFPSPPPLPNLAVPSLLWHVVYGTVVGAVFPLVVNR